MITRSFHVMVCFVPALAAAADKPVQFVCHRIGHVRSEAHAVADFTGDGRLDIVAGPHLYAAPEWQPAKIRSLQGKVDEQGKGYFDDFANLPVDVDGDGLLDVVSCGWFNKSVMWFRQQKGAEWTGETVDSGRNYETAELVDINGDGKAREVLADCAETIWYEPGTLTSGGKGMLKHVVSNKSMSFGGGVGDVNGDGRPDILRPEAWFEGPTDPVTGTWTPHTWALGGKDGKTDHTPQILVMDVNGDHLADIVTSNAHKHGIFWYEQQRAGDQTTWRQHVIDDTWTQAHSLALADIDGDGTPDLVTGKRFMAHNGGDPDENGKLGVYWYQLKRGNQPAWTRHPISYDEGIGSGLNITTVDLDHDGDIDVVVTGKWGGPAWFENKRK